MWYVSILYHDNTIVEYIVNSFLECEDRPYKSIRAVKGRAFHRTISRASDNLLACGSIHVLDAIACCAGS